MLCKLFLPMEFYGFDSTYFYTVNTPLIHWVFMYESEFLRKPHLAYKRDGPEGVNLCSSYSLHLRLFSF